MSCWWFSWGEERTADVKHINFLLKNIMSLSYHLNVKPSPPTEKLNFKKGESELFHALLSLVGRRHCLRQFYILLYIYKKKTSLTYFCLFKNWHENLAGTKSSKLPAYTNVDLGPSVSGQAAGGAMGRPCAIPGRYGCWWLHEVRGRGSNTQKRFSVASVP